MTWGTLNQLRAHIQDDRVHSLTKTVELLASQTELALQDEDLHRIRRLLLDTQATGLFHTLSINYANDQVLISTDPESAYRDTLPEVWGQSAVPFERKSRLNTEINQLTIYEPIRVSASHTATLVAESMPIPELMMLWRFELASMIAALCGFVLGMVAWLQMGQRTAPLIAIRSALTLYAQGKRDTQSLMVSSDMGIETHTFNELLRERDDIKSQLAIRQCEEAIMSTARDTAGLSSVCAALSQGMIVLDANLNIQFINGAGAVYLQADPSLSIGKTLGQIDSNELLVPSAKATLNPDSARRQVVEIELELEQDSAYLRVTCTRIVRDEDTMCLLFIEDITQQRHADESLNAFIAQTTHELRTPLTNIRLYAEEAIDAGSEDEEFRSNAFNMINSESRRLERLVSDMLCVSELEAGSMNLRKDSVRPEAMFEELQRDYAQQAESKNIKLVFDLPPKFPAIEADRDRLGQAIHNLVGNALKYTPPEGSVTVTVEFDPSDSMTVRISDTGIGISQEDQSRVFERFCRAQDQRIESISGSGLGLAITSEIVKMHAGKISVESELDQGSTFILTIPSGRSTNNMAA
ncbi:MAG: ATP-binding protein [Phycisphaerales bacterium]